MKKRDILKIFTAAEVARLFDLNRSTIIRWGKEVPIKYHEPLKAAAKKKVLVVNRALERIKRN